MLAPFWAQLKIGPLLRGESDSRLYYDLFHRNQSDIAGLQRLWVRLRATAAPEPEDLGAHSNLGSSSCVLITFSGLADYFRRLLGWESFLYEQLLAITWPRWKLLAGQPLKGPIAIHIRRGDFATPQSPEELRTRGSVRTPLTWFVETLTAVRRAVADQVPAYVVSDGTRDELAGILQLKNVDLVRTGSAIGDLLLLARAKVLIGSGGSSFSAWASFLGQMPTVTVPGQSLSWFKLSNSGRRYFGEFDPVNPEYRFLDQVKTALA
jgi:hypothetical protein